MEGSAYGAGMAGKPFDPITYIKKPSVILRIISLVFAIIVFGCIASEGQKPFGSDIGCAYGNSASACGFGIFVGVIAFLASMAFLVIDALFDNWSNISHRKFAVIGDLGFSGAWAFMYFVCFCLLTNKWVNTAKTGWETGNSALEATIAFCFFSIITWTMLAVLAFMKFRQGSQSAFAPSFEPSEPTPYPGPATSVGNDSYQQPPFDAAATPESAPSQPQYQAPSY